MAVSRRRFIQGAVAGTTIAPALMHHTLAQKTDTAGSSVLHFASTLPLSGPLGLTGAALAAGMQAVVAHCNAEGGIHGHILRLHVLDDAYDVQTAEQNIRLAAKQNPLLACIACGGTPANQRLIPLLEQQKIPYVAPFTGSDSVRLPDYTHTFHIRAGYHDEVRGLIRTVRRMGIGDIGIVYAANAFGQSLRDTAIRVMHEHGDRPVAAESVRMDAADAVQAARRIWSARPSAVFLATSGRASVKVLQQLKDLAVQLPAFTTSVGFPPGAHTVLKDRMTGTGIMQVVPNPEKQSVKLVRHYRQTMRSAGADYRSPASMEGYINMQVMVEALQRAGERANRRSLLQALRSMRDWNMGGYRIDFGASAPYQGSQYTDLGVVSRSGRVI